MTYNPTNRPRYSYFLGFLGMHYQQPLCADGPDGGPALISEKIQLHHNNIAMALLRCLSNRLRLGHYNVGDSKVITEALWKGVKTID